MSTQTVSAAQAVGEMLQSPDDLAKIMTFRKKLEKEKASIDAKLKSGVKDQLDATREALKKLLNSRDNVRAIKEEMTTIDRMCGEQQFAVKTFDKINRVRLITSTLVHVPEPPYMLGFCRASQLFPDGGNGQQPFEYARETRCPGGHATCRAE